MTPAAIADAHARVRADPAIQFDLPAYQPPVTPEWLLWLGRHLGFLGDAGTILFWLVVAGVTILLAALLVRLARRWRWKVQSAGPVEPEPWRPEAAAARALLNEADAMASHGRFAAAARLLLHRSLEEVARHRPALVRPAATTREIGGASVLPATARTAFTPIAAAVERSLFGGDDLTLADWEQARAAYAGFALAGTWA